jgi:glycosyltransferase 2 family protein
VQPVTVSAPPPPAPGWKTWLRRGYAVALLVAAVVVAISQRETVSDLLTGTRPAPLVLAVVLGLLSLVQAAWFWSRALAGLGEPRSVAATLEATVASVPARYVPGSVWYAAGRIAHLRSTGSPAVSLTVVAVLETLLSFMVAVALGVGLVAASGSDADGASVLALAGTAGALALLASPWVVNPLLRWVARRRGVRAVPALRWSVELELCAHLVFFWLTSAAAFVVYLEAFPAVETDGTLQTAGSFLLSWAAGFLAVFAPQGAGVFETAVASSLGGASVAALAVVVAGYRAVTAVRDAIALALLAAYRSLARR